MQTSYFKKLFFSLEHILTAASKFEVTKTTKILLPHYKRGKDVGNNFIDTLILSFIVKKIEANFLSCSIKKFF